tara:strand:- start:1444 stop:2445 length:1002 start_codon:yes stop_codon:yes gene_type:complete
MATIGATFFDLVDLYKRQDEKGNIAPVIEMLTQMNPVLDDAVAVECNSGQKHLHSVRAGLPAVTWGKLYQGVPNDKSRVSQVEDTTGFVEGLSTVDKRILTLAGSKAGAVRLSEAQSYLESMNQEVGTKMFYGNTASDPEQFMGFAPRFNEKSAPNGNQIVDAGGTGADNTSVWFVTWGDNQCQTLYPQGTKAGVTREDKGEQRVVDSNGNAYYAKEEMFTWHIGLAVKDWRYVARVANIDVSLLQAGSVDIYTFLRKAYYKLQSRRVAGGKMAIYCNREVLEALDAAAQNAGANDNFVRLSRSEIDGKEVLAYRGIPIRETDALLNTEARVV